MEPSYWIIGLTILANTPGVVSDQFLKVYLHEFCCWLWR